MPPLPIVEELDILEEVGARLSPIAAKITS
jgi:hypothetical protein